MEVGVNVLSAIRQLIYSASFVKSGYVIHSWQPTALIMIIQQAMIQNILPFLSMMI